MKKISDENSVKFMLEDIVGCKWSLSVLDALEQGINRPGELTRTVNGITTKVLNERLRKLLRYKIIQKKEFDESPPRVEYSFTNFGEKILKIVQQIRTLENEYSQLL